MNHYLVEPATGAIIGSAILIGGGWRFTPHTSARRPSTKLHATMGAAAKHYLSDSRRWIEADNFSHAVEQMKVLKVAYALNQPCTTCKHYESSTSEEGNICSKGHTPSAARKMFYCLQFEAVRPVPAEPVVARETKPDTASPCLCRHCSNLIGDECAAHQSIVQAIKTDSCPSYANVAMSSAAVVEKTYPCPRHPDVLRHSPDATCRKCEGDIDAAILPTLRDEDRKLKVDLCAGCEFGGPKLGRTSVEINCYAGASMASARSNGTCDKYRALNVASVPRNKPLRPRPLVHEPCLSCCHSDGIGGCTQDCSPPVAQANGKCSFYGHLKVKGEPVYPCKWHPYAYRSSPVAICPECLLETGTALKVSALNDIRIIVNTMLASHAERYGWGLPTGQYACLEHIQTIIADATKP